MFYKKMNDNHITLYSDNNFINVLYHEIAKFIKEKFVYSTIIRTISFLSVEILDILSNLIYYTKKSTDKNYININYEFINELIMKNKIVLSKKHRLDTGFIDNIKKGIVERVVYEIFNINFMYIIINVYKDNEWKGKSHFNINKSISLINDSVKSVNADELNKNLNETLYALKKIKNKIYYDVYDIEKTRKRKREEVDIEEVYIEERADIEEPKSKKVKKENIYKIMLNILLLSNIDFKKKIIK